MISPYSYRLYHIPTFGSIHEHAYKTLFVFLSMQFFFKFSKNITIILCFGIAWTECVVGESTLFSPFARKLFASQEINFLWYNQFIPDQFGCEWVNQINTRGFSLWIICRILVQFLSHKLKTRPQCMGNQMPTGPVFRWHWKLG